MDKWLTRILLFVVPMAVSSLLVIIGAGALGFIQGSDTICSWWQNAIFGGLLATGVIVGLSLQFYWFRKESGSKQKPPY